MSRTRAVLATLSGALCLCLLGALTAVSSVAGTVDLAGRHLQTDDLRAPVAASLALGVGVLLIVLGWPRIRRQASLERALWAEATAGADRQ